MPSMPVGERRFKEGLGVRYLKNGKTRCQALAKGKLRAARARTGDYESDNETFWPEAQCHRAACFGAYVCELHGGETPSIAPKTILDLMPIDLVEYMRIAQENPDYISRRDEILLLKAREMQLLQGLADELPSDEAWDLVEEAYKNINKNELAKAADLLREALSSKELVASSWRELNSIIRLMGETTSTQVRTAKELRLMATTEQVTNLFAEVQRILVDIGDEYFGHDPNAREKYLQWAGARLARLANTRTAGISRQLTDGSE